MKYNDQIAETIKKARNIAIELGDNYISSHHFILAMAGFENAATTIFNSNKLDFLSLKKALQKKRLTQIPEKMHLTKEFEVTLKIAAYYSWLHHSRVINAEHYVLAMLADKRSLAGDYLRNCNINYSAFQNSLKVTTRTEIFKLIGRSNMLIQFGLVKALSGLLAR